MSTVQEIVASTSKTLEELRAKIAEESSRALSGVFETFFKTYPRVKTIYWTQYTPYFNDGDSCTFRVGEICFSPREHGDIEDYYSGQEMEGEGADFSTYSDDRVSADMIADMNAVSRFLNEIEDHLLSAYEDHAFVKVHRGGAVVDEYSHD